MKLSVIIPTLNEEKNIAKLVRHLLQHQSGQPLEILVIDAGSSDQTVKLAREAGATVVENAPRGRALQMNLGAAKASGSVLFFVHGDTLPLATYRQDIEEALAEGFPMGCYRYRFDSDRPLLKINAFFTRFDLLWCRGGDQTLFITRELFVESGGFSPKQVIMEDFEFLKRVKGRYPFKIIPKSIVVSARKYEENSYLRVQVANLLAFNMFRFGFAPQKIAAMYNRMLNYR